MDNVSAVEVVEGFWRSPSVPAYVEITRRVLYWHNRIYLGIGELSLTWPVTAFLRSL
jgi:hypothetical protein